MKRPLLALLLSAALVSAATPAMADDSDPAAEARKEYGLGTQAFAKKQYPEAAQHYEAAAAAKPSAIALYIAAQAWELAQRPERAADAYSRSLDVAGLDARQGATARQQIATIEKSFGTVSVTAPDGWRVQLESYTEVPTPARLHGPPGQHVIAVRIPGKPLERREVMLEAGKLTLLDLKDEPKPRAEEPEPKHELPPPPQPTSQRTPEPFWTTLRVVGVGAAGFGVAALGATVVLGLNANGSEEAYKAAPTRATFDHASSLQTWTNVALVSGLVLVAAGVVLFVLPHEKHRSERAFQALGGRF